MRRLNLIIHNSGKISAFGIPSRKEVALSDNPAEVLREIFPDRAGYWKKRQWDFLNISFLPVFPFGPEPDDLSDFLFDDLAGDLELLLRQFKLKGISISGLKTGILRNIPGIKTGQRIKRQELSLSALEAKKMIEVVRSGGFTDSVLLSVFLDRDNIHTYVLPPETDYEALFTSVPELNSYKAEDFTITAGGISVSGTASIGPVSENYINRKEWGIKRNSGLLFSYPEFNRKITMAKQEETVQDTCVNCLTCASVCPAGLYPSTLFHHLKSGGFTEASDAGLKYCLFCSCCSAACPSDIPLSSEIIRSVRDGNGGSL